VISRPWGFSGAALQTQPARWVCQRTDVRLCAMDFIEAWRLDSVTATAAREATPKFGEDM
jgi:hypothetical protein